MHWEGLMQGLAHSKCSADLNCCDRQLISPLEVFAVRWRVSCIPIVQLTVYSPVPWPNCLRVYGICHPEGMLVSFLECKLQAWISWASILRKNRGEIDKLFVLTFLQPELPGWGCSCQETSFPALPPDPTFGVTCHPSPPSFSPQPSRPTLSAVGLSPPCCTLLQQRTYPSGFRIWALRASLQPRKGSCGTPFRILGSITRHWWGGPAQLPSLTLEGTGGQFPSRVEGVPGQAALNVPLHGVRKWVPRGLPQGGGYLFQVVHTSWLWGVKD